jgi:hypothetical protein
VKTQPENIARLALLHVRRYTNMLASYHHRPDDSHVNPHDVQHYLGIWQSIQSKGHIWAQLDSAEQAEVRDALEDEEN